MLRVTVVNAATEKTVVLDGTGFGEVALFAAVRGSASIPCVFQEFSLTLPAGLIVCWDGGLTGNCRFDLALAGKAENAPVVAASSLTYSKASAPPRWYQFYKKPVLKGMGTIHAAMAALEEERYKQYGNRPDFIYIRADTPADIETHRFGLSPEKKMRLIDLGWAAATGKLSPPAGAALPAWPRTRQPLELLRDCANGDDDAREEFSVRYFNVALFQVHDILRSSRRSAEFSEERIREITKDCCRVICREYSSMGYWPDLRSWVRVRSRVLAKEFVKDEYWF